MILFIKYKGLDDAMKKLIYQVIDSLDYCAEHLPADVRTPDELFKYLKAVLVYKNDPPHVELFQTAQTLIENNYHKIKGAGDCDDFVIIALAYCVLLNIPAKIILAGRTLKFPVHIYLKTYDAGRWKPFDLTEPKYDSERDYKYSQTIAVKVRKKPQRKKFYKKLAFLK